MLMRIIKSLALGLSIFSTAVLAENQELQINLKSFEVIHPQEKRGDELYISITEFSKNNLPRNYKVPPFPSHWLSRYLNSFKEMTLWRKSFEQCEPLDLLITLVEEDAEPWDPDDSLGSVKLQISCTNGKLEEKWVIPNSEKVSEIAKKKNAFHFKGSNAQYDMQFSLDNVAVKPLDKIKPKEAIPQKQ